MIVDVEKSNVFLQNSLPFNCQIFDKQLRLDSSFQYKFSPQEGFRQIRFRNDVKLSGPWSFWLDLILIDTNSSINTNLENFKNKDQLWLGASYEL